MMYATPAFAAALTILLWRSGGARTARVMMRNCWPWRAEARDPPSSS